MRLLNFIVCIALMGSQAVFAQVSDVDDSENWDTLSVAQANDHIGSFAVFCDEVQWANLVEDQEYKPTIVKLGKSNPGLTLQIWQEDAMKLFGKPAPEVFKPGTKVCVNGTVNDYKGNPRMEIGMKEQVEFVK